MKEGDSRRVRVFLNSLTIWFQAASQFDYTMECLHLTACLTKLWSSDLANYWMEKLRDSTMNESQTGQTGKKNKYRI